MNVSKFLREEAGLSAKVINNLNKRSVRRGFSFRKIGAVYIKEFDDGLYVCLENHETGEAIGYSLAYYRSMNK